MRNVLGALALVLLTTLGVAAPSHGEGTLPRLPTVPEGDVAGVNDWSCRPTVRRPRPVILVHGTFGDRRHLLEDLATSMMNKGFCVFALDYGNRGTQEISRSAQQLKAFTQRVRRATGAKKVSMVGHSQGGMMPRYYIKFLGGARHVDDLVGIAPSNHGTSHTGGDSNLISDLVGVLCQSCTQQGAGSPFLRRLNAGDETPGRVSYTQITTRYDEVVVPHTSGYLESGPRTTNVTIQGLCRSDLAEHLFIPLSRTTVALTLDALTHRGPARPSAELGC
ncbi:MAG: lipase family protein [Actinomycetota bacterium]|nr:lipase family protein [Actinomycetota bacterium]